jgi:tetratricopeptide (TPR) repeat protein
VSRTIIMVAITLALATVAHAADNIAAAREHFKRGTRAYDLGQYQDAIREYEAAYHAKDDPALLFNIAQAYRLAGDLTNAIRSYRSFLRRVPTTENRAEVEQRIEELQKAIANKGRIIPVIPEPTTAPVEHQKTLDKTREPELTQPVIHRPPPTVARVDNPGRTKRIAGITLMSFGVAAGVGGIVMGILAQQAGDDLTRINDRMLRFDSSLERAGATYEIIEGVLIAVGVAAAVTGVVLYVVGRRQKSVSLRSDAVGQFGRATLSVSF